MKSDVTEIVSWILHLHSALSRLHGLHTAARNQPG